MPNRPHYDPDQPRVPSGHHDGGQWTREGSSHDAQVQHVKVDPRRFVIQKGIEAALTLFAWLQSHDGPGQQAIIIFKARRYHAKGEMQTELDVEDFDLLNRDEVKEACPGIDDVQEITDNATKKVREDNISMNPSQFGTAVHLRIERTINGPGGRNQPRDPNFRAEESQLKREEEVDDGDKRSIRVDVLENKGNGTVCVYDIKTGRRGLTPIRMAEIAAVFKNYEGTKHIIVTEIRPQ